MAGQREAEINDATTKHIVTSVDELKRDCIRVGLSRWLTLRRLNLPSIEIPPSASFPHPF
jgi:hypothetical protein